MTNFPQGDDGDDEIRKRGADEMGKFPSVLKERRRPVSGLLNLFQLRRNDSDGRHAWFVHPALGGQRLSEIFDDVGEADDIFEEAIQSRLDATRYGGGF